MPGVPFEMAEMMESYVIPHLKEKIGDTGFYYIKKNFTYNRNSGIFFV